MRRSSGPVAGAPAAVLIHGVVSSRYLLPTATALARRCAVLAPDLPGFGRSSRSRRKVVIEAQADLLDELIAWAGFRRPTVLGHSVGAQVAASLALRHPEAVGRLVLVGPTGDPRVHSVAAVFARWLCNAPAEPLRFNALASRELLEVGSRQMIRTLRAALADPFLDNLGRVVVPTLVIRGQRDRVASQRWAEEAGGRLRSARVVVVPGVAHTVVYSAPSELAGLVADFAGGGHGPPGWFPRPATPPSQRESPPTPPSVTLVGGSQARAPAVG